MASGEYLYTDPPATSELSGVNDHILVLRKPIL